MDTYYYNIDENGNPLITQYVFDQSINQDGLAINDESLNKNLNGEGLIILKAEGEIIGYYNQNMIIHIFKKNL